MATHRFEDRPVPLARHDQTRTRLVRNDFAERKRFFERARMLENARMGADPNDRREHLRRNSIGRRAAYDFSEPGPIGFVLIGIRSKGVNQDVDVRKDQARPSIRSSSAALSPRSTPGSVPPVARETGNTTRARGGLFPAGRRRTERRPSSINAVSVTPRRDASRRARSSKSSSRRTVVRICHSISIVCLYVK